MKKENVFWLIGYIAAALVFAGCLWWLLAPGDQLPDYMLGRWQSNHPKYADRYFEINETTLIFSTGEDTEDMYFINKIVSEESDVGDSYVVECNNQESLDFSFSFTYESKEGGLIRFRHPNDVVWFRVDGI